jgi:hypothetical protein
MGGRNVQADVLVLIQPRHDASMRMSREVIKDRMELAALIRPIELFEEGEELHVGVALRDHPVYHPHPAMPCLQIELPALHVPAFRPGLA